MRWRGAPARAVRAAAAASTLLLVLACVRPGLSLSAEQADCTGFAAQQDRNACISAATAKADEALNRVYRQLSAKLDTLGRRNLTAAENAWITFRDRECAFRAGYDRDASANTGTIVPFLVGQCRLELTEARTRSLAEQVRCPGGDMSCTP